MLKKTEGQRM